MHFVAFHERKPAFNVVLNFRSEGEKEVHQRGESTHTTLLVLERDIWTQRLRRALKSDKIQPPIDFVDWQMSHEDEDMSVWRALSHPHWSSAWGDA